MIIYLDLIVIFQLFNIIIELYCWDLFIWIGQIIIIDCLFRFNSDISII